MASSTYVASKVEFDKDEVIEYFGHNYRWKLCGLLYLLNIAQKDWTIQLATNVKDIVLKVKRGSNWITSFVNLQLKEDTSEPGVDKSDFLVAKYFTSYCTVKERMKEGVDSFEGDIEFIIYTNSEPDEYLSKFVMSDISQIGGAIEEQTGTVLNIRPHGELTTRLQDQCLASASRNGFKATENDFEDFLRRFYVVCVAQSEIEFDALIKKELNKVLRQENSRVSWNDGFMIFMEEVKKWWKDETLVLNQNSEFISKVIELVLAETHSAVQRIKLSLDIKYSQKSLEELNDKLTNRLIIIDCDNTPVELTFTKLLQLLESRANVFTILNTKSWSEEQDAVIATWKSNRGFLIIVDEDREDCEIWTRLCDILNNNEEKRVIYISHNHTLLPEHLDHCYPCTKFIVKFKIQELEEISQNSILDQPILFQGEEINFREIFLNDMDLANSVLESSLVTIVRSGEVIKVGKEVPENVPYFINRTVTLRNTVSEDILKNKSDDRIAISGNSRQQIFILRNKYPDSKFIILNIETAKEEYSKLCKQDGNVHWIQIEGGLMKWIESKGSLELIRAYIDKSIITCLKSIEDIEGRLVLLVADPGMGKTTLMNDLATKFIQTRKCNKDSAAKCIILIDLNNHISLLKQYQEKEMDAVKFLTSAAGFEELTLERDLLTAFLNSRGKVIVLLDGVDEISPAYFQVFCDFITSLLQTQVHQVWVSSRQSVQEQLERKLLAIPIMLQELSDEEQRLLLSNYWMESTVDELLTLFHSSLNNNVNLLTGIPLQLKMLAQVFQRNVNSEEAVKLPECLDLFEIIQNFINKKFNIACNKKPNTADLELNYKKNYRNFVKNHIMAAMDLLLNLDEISFNVSDNELKNERQKFLREFNDGLERTGIITKLMNHEGKLEPVFTHRLFAEYFVAKWLAENYESNKPFLRKHLYKTEFKVIRQLFDRFLARDCDLKEDETFFLSLDGRCALHRAVLRGDVEDVVTLLKHLDVDRKDHGGRTALHLASCLGIASSSKADIIIEEILQRNARVDVEDNVFQFTPIGYAFHAESWNVLEIYLRTGYLNKDHKELQALLQDSSKQEIFVKYDLVNLISLIPNNASNAELCSFLLHKSAVHGSIKVCELLLSNKVNATFTDENQNTPLHQACVQGYSNVVQLLLDSFDASDKKTYVNCLNVDKTSAISLACEHDDLDLIRSLIAAGADVRIANVFNKTPLHVAVSRGYLNVVQFLLDSIDDIDQRTNYVNFHYTNSAVHLACLGGHIDIVNVLLEAGADITLRDMSNVTSLMVMCQEGRLEIVKALLGSIRKPNEKRMYVNHLNNGKTALYEACLGGHIDIVNTLIEADVDVTLRDKHFQTPLNVACEKGNLSIIRALLDNLKDRGVESEYIKTVNRALRWCCYLGHADIVAFLLERGANIRDGEMLQGKVLSVACENGYLDVVKVLLNSFKDPEEKVGYVNARRCSSYSDLHLACRDGHVQVVKYLLDLGADFTLRDIQNNTPLHEACRRGYLEVVELLLGAITDSNRRRDFINSCGEFKVRDIPSLVVFSESPMTDSEEEFGGFEALFGDVNVACSEGQAVKHLKSPKMIYNNEIVKDCWTAICLASGYGHVEVVKMLIDTGADISSFRDVVEVTKLFNASRCNLPNVAKEVLDGIPCQADRRKLVRTKNYIMETPLLVACGRDHVDVVDVLVEYGADVNDIDRYGMTALRYACYAGSLRVVQNLVERVNKEERASYIKESCGCGIWVISTYQSSNQKAITDYLMQEGGVW